ncbi:MAG: hypothetical protein JXJ20_01785 [Anaerolineae bacterium]|jgi:uncharacterized protein YbjT (DUF2867 family)|nr:hypothetical protein [Anaerolineae bacterium]
MPIKMEQLPGESIINATINEPFDPDRDIPALFAEFIPLRLAIQGDVALILDFSSVVSKPNSFSPMVLSMAEASRGVRASKEAGVGRPPITIFVGSGPIANLAAQAMEQEQYGGTRGHLCATYDEALALARAKLST